MHGCICDTHQDHDVDERKQRLSKVWHGLGLSKISYNRRLEMLNIESLEERRLRSDLIMCYKILRGFVNLDRSMFFVLAESSRTRSNSMKLYKHSCNSNFYANFFGTVL